MSDRRSDGSAMSAAGSHVIGGVEAAYRHSDAELSGNLGDDD